MPHMRGKRRPPIAPSAVPAASRNVRMLPASPRHQIALVLDEIGEEIWNLEEIHQFVSSSLERILRERRVARADLKAPALEIAIPAIEAMRFCCFRLEMARLIATSMDVSISHLAHPSFVDVLKQLTQDELNMIAALPGDRTVVPIGHLHMPLDGNRTQTVYRNIVPQSLAGLCKEPRAIPGYIDNLRRLEILHTPPGLRIDDRVAYHELRSLKMCRSLVDAHRPHTLQLERSLITLTDFGRTFRSACLT